MRLAFGAWRPSPSCIDILCGTRDSNGNKGKEWCPVFRRQLSRTSSLKSRGASLSHFLIVTPNFLSVNALLFLPFVNRPAGPVSPGFPCVGEAVIARSPAPWSHLSCSSSSSVQAFPVSFGCSALLLRLSLWPKRACDFARFRFLLWYLSIIAPIRDLITCRVAIMTSILGRDDVKAFRDIHKSTIALSRSQLLVGTIDDTVAGPPAIKIQWHVK